MVIDLKECARLLRENDNFLILSHEHPDGDTLGSAFALFTMLHRLGKKCVFECCDEVPKDFYYIKDSVVNDNITPEYIVAVDVADDRLLGSLCEKYKGKVDLCIDHHMSNTYYAKNVLVEDRAAACELIFELCGELSIPVDTYIGNCIYTGISTDTGCFRYQNTTSGTFKIASSLMETGIDSKLINKLMFETKTKSFLALELLARKTLEYYCNGKCAVMTITQDMYNKSGSNEHECYPITALPRQIEGVLVGAVIKQKGEKEYSISVRTEGGIDASAICAALGGGGHKGAAGCTFSGEYEEVKKALLNAIEAAITE